MSILGITVALLGLKSNKSLFAVHVQAAWTTIASLFIPSYRGNLSLSPLICYGLMGNLTIELGYRIVSAC